jgi:hypothetical protein
MCEDCIRAHKERMEVINEEMDNQGVPEDSLLRGLADVHDACSHHPVLLYLMSEMWPTTDTLTH